MGLAIGFTEMQMIQMVKGLKDGLSFEEASEPFRALVEPEAFERNREWLINRANDQLEAEKPPTLKVEKPTHHKK
jgi:hypothetical protein